MVLLPPSRLSVRPPLDILDSFVVYWPARRAGALGVVGTPQVPGSDARGARPIDERLVSGGGTPLGTPVPPDGPAQCDAGLDADLGVLAAARRCHSSRSNFPCALDDGRDSPALPPAEGGVPQLASQHWRFSSLGPSLPPLEHARIPGDRPGDRPPPAAARAAPALSGSASVSTLASAPASASVTSSSESRPGSMATSKGGCPAAAPSPPPPQR